MIDDSSIITDNQGNGYSNCDITSILSASGGSHSDRENQFNQLSSLQFLDRNELLVKLTRIIFEDFCTHIHGMHSRIVQDKEDKNECFLDFLRKFLETLLLWNEECSLFSPTDFSRISDEDALKLTDTENI
uniref:Uncharacterized protein n=1 Tax=Meloidogyne hapla TaxID=6305 RepID=A0A1I8AZU2_MELHA